MARQKDIRRGAYRVPLHLTEAGEKLTRELYDIAGGAATYISEQVGEKEMESFYNTLEKISQNLKDYMASIGNDNDEDDAE